MWQLYSIISKGSVHTTPDKFENATLFLRLGIPSTLIRTNCPPKTTENGTFRKRFPSCKEWINLKTPARRFSVEGQHFENGTFRKLSLK